MCYIVSHTPDLVGRTDIGLSPDEARPFLRWAGSKRQRLPALLALVPPKFDRYVEPFAGSACMFYALAPPRAMLGDINSDLITTYIALKNNVSGVIKSLARFTCTKDEYYRVRSQDATSISPERRAARFIFLNRLCFNGLFRTNRLGQFNVPYGGGRKAGHLPSSGLLRACAVALRRSALRAQSFEETLAHVRPGDFVYLDPPYSIQSRRVFNEYSHFNFGPTELQCLRKQLLRLTKIGIPFLVSYGVSREAHELSKGFRCREIVVQRQIAGFATKRRRSRELLITNY